MAAANTARTRKPVATARGGAGKRTSRKKAPVRTQALRQTDAKKARQMQSKAKGRPPRDLKNVDADWIQNRIKAQHRSQRELAAAWGGVSAAAVTRVLHNNRRLTLDEFVTLCEFLDVSPNALLPKLGYDVRTAHTRLPIVGAVTDDAQVTFVTPEAGRLIEVKTSVSNGKAKLLVVRAKAGPLASWAGSLVLYTETPRGSLPAFDRLAVVEVAGEVVPILGVLRRGNKAKTMSLRRFASMEEHDVEDVINAHPVRQLILDPEL